MSEATASKLVKVYLKLREARAELKQRDEELDQQQKLIQNELLELCKSMGAESIRTEFGTIIRSTQRRYWTNDWDSFYKFIKEHDAFQLLQKRITNTNMAQFLEENPDLHPPGLNVDAEYTVSVRRK